MKQTSSSPSKYKIHAKYLLVAIVLLASTGCVMHQTVKQGGETISSGYVIKRPIKDALDNSNSQ